MNVFALLIPWEPSILVVAGFLSAAWCYAKGSGNESLPRKAMFWSGLTLSYVVLQTQYDYYAEHAFFMHRLQHLVLHHLSPFLIAASLPGSALRRGLPSCAGKKLMRLTERMSFLDVLSNPVAAVLIFDGLIVFWLIPSMQLAGMMDWRLYRIMNWSMLVNGLMFWQMVLDPASRYSFGKRIAVMLAICPAQIIMGALLCFSARDLYPVYNICGRIFPLTPVADQQIGGIILWVPGAMMSIIGVIFVIWRELKPSLAAPSLPQPESSGLP